MPTLRELWALLMRTVPGLTPERVDDAFTWEQALMWWDALAATSERERTPETRTIDDDEALARLI